MVQGLCHTMKGRGEEGTVVRGAVSLRVCASVELHDSPTLF